MKTILLFWAPGGAGGNWCGGGGGNWRGGGGVGGGVESGGGCVSGYVGGGDLSLFYQGEGVSPGRQSEPGAGKPLCSKPAQVTCVDTGK